MGGLLTIVLILFVLMIIFGCPDEGENNKKSEEASSLEICAGWYCGKCDKYNTLECDKYSETHQDRNYYDRICMGFRQDECERLQEEAELEAAIERAKIRGEDIDDEYTDN